jgi:glutathione peroxidase
VTYLTIERSIIMKSGAALLAATIVAAIIAGPSTPVVAAAAPQNCPAFLNQDFRKLHSSESVNICKLSAGKPMLIVNTASNCGYTPQYKGLEAVHAKYKSRGLVVVGFASNDFNQESKDEAKSAEICFLNNGVTFTVLADTHVKGAEANAVFKELNKQSTEPKWNFNKYLVTADGKVSQYFDSKVTPESEQFTAAIEKVLK